MREAIYPPVTANATFLDALAWCGVAWLSDKQHEVRQLLPELAAARPGRILGELGNEEGNRSPFGIERHCPSIRP